VMGEYGINGIPACLILDKDGSIFAVITVRVVSRVGQKMRKLNFLASADIFFLYQRHLWEPIIFWFRIRNM
jgi:hypothetical protein